MQHISHLIQQYGLLVVFLNVLLEQSGLPLPSYPILLVAGALTLAGGPATPTLVAAIAAALIADVAWYIAGARLGRRVLTLLCKISLSPDSCVRQTENVFTRIGPWALLFVKFVPGLGLVTVAMAGITGVSVPLFLLLDGIGGTVYFAVPIVLGRIFHDAIDATLDTLAQLGEYGTIILLGAFALYIAIRWIQRQAFIRQLRMDRISVDELAEMIDGGKNPVIFDVRPSDVRLREGIIPGALSGQPSDIQTVLKKYPREAEIVIYCSCPNEASAAIAARDLKRAGFKKIRPLRGGIEAWAKAGRPVEVSRAA